MERLVLIRPALEHKTAAEEFKQEFIDRGEKVINGSALLDQLDYGAWLEHTTKNSNPETVQKGWVVADTYFAALQNSGRLVGMIDIRHDLSGSEFLTKYGGHIGYSVRPSERRNGYAVQMLKLALALEKERGLHRVMLGCYCDNAASKKTIERCGGRLTETKPYTDGKLMDVYWIEL